MTIDFYVGAMTLAGATDSEIAAAYAASVAGPMKAAMSHKATYRGISVGRCFPLPVGVTTDDNTGTAAGTAAVDMMATQVSGIITKRTSFGGRAFRGRMYVPFVPVDAADGSGKPTGAYGILLAAVGVAACSSFIVVGAGGNTTMVPCLFHRKGYIVGTPPPVGVNTITPVTNLTLSSKFATQRRRGMYGRPNP